MKLMHQEEKISLDNVDHQAKLVEQLAISAEKCLK